MSKKGDITHASVEKVDMPFYSPDLEKHNGTYRAEVSKDDKWSYGYGKTEAGAKADAVRRINDDKPRHSK